MIFQPSVDGVILCFATSKFQNLLTMMHWSNRKLFSLDHIAFLLGAEVLTTQANESQAKVL